MILCNPHNPIGRNWSADELTRILRLANEHQARVVADEIHGDLTLALGEDYTPVLSLPRSLTGGVVMLMSPSKTFSEPGIQAALALAPYPLIPPRWQRVLRHVHRDQPGLASVAGTIASYTQGARWHQAMRGGSTTWASVRPAAVAGQPVPRQRR